MLKKPASFVLASLRGSTYRSVRLASSLAAALLDGLFEHPANHGKLYPVDDGMAGKRFAGLFRRRYQRCAETCRTDPESGLGRTQAGAYFLERLEGT